MKTNYLVTNPEGKSRIKNAFDKFQAIASCISDDGGKYTVKQYTVKKLPNQ